MDYESKYNRVVKLFEIQSQTKSEILRLSKKDGLYYFMKLWGNNLFYVHDNRKVMKYNLDTKERV